MAARITALVAEIQSALKLIDGYSDPKTGLTFGFGEKSIVAAGRPPRVIWVPTDAKHSPASKDRTNPRRILTREPVLVAHCWGRDYDATEDLVHNVIVKLHEAAWGSISLLGEQWDTGANVDLGVVALVSFSVMVPVEKRPYLTVAPTMLEKDTTGSVAGDGYIDWGEP